MLRILLVIVLTILLAACSSNSIKEKINQAGDVAGQTAGEFLEGAAKGVQKAFDVKMIVPDSLRAMGIEFGKATVSSDSVGIDNLLVIYVIYTKNFEGKLTAKVFDDQSQEMGRAFASLSGKKDEAQFIEFHFDKRTNIDSKNRLTLE